MPERGFLHNQLSTAQGWVVRTHPHETPDLYGRRRRARKASLLRKLHERARICPGTEP